MLKRVRAGLEIFESNVRPSVECFDSLWYVLGGGCTFTAEVGMQWGSCWPETLRRSGNHTDKAGLGRETTGYPLEMNTLGSSGGRS